VFKLTVGCPPTCSIGAGRQRLPLRARFEALRTCTPISPFIVPQQGTGTEEGCGTLPYLAQRRLACPFQDWSTATRVTRPVFLADCAHSPLRSPPQPQYSAARPFGPTDESRRRREQAELAPSASSAQRSRDQPCRIPCYLCLCAAAGELLPSYQKWLRPPSLD